MPELPEVEVVKRSLENNIINLNIKKVTINTNKLRYKINKSKFKKIKDIKILDIKRRSKYLLINLEKNITILVHLGMTGKFFILEKSGKRKKTSFYYKLNKNEKKHNHIIFSLSKGKKLVYNDVRKFGFVKVVASKNILMHPHLKFLGPEPLLKNFNFKYLENYIQDKKKYIKSLLMDQKFVSGLGNIYVNEILFLSKIKPNKRIKMLNIEEMKKIIHYTKLILKKSIKEGGSSIKDFNDSEGKQGVFQQQFNVYGRVGKKCTTHKCDNVIKKMIISQRATFFCKSCQK
ncbi:bifunctional DNA-formamidopyrimidine glycosylase/DNA-(apurinic or apyrimidinic site) lyase [Pelagibacteraceae bacterium]|nr:bifunctional DNA-formamidopyrimidine glycosylase/DNA-(apurinic or apyrimidinic site) lyase [Pelagibacteraceae bacterium]